jgi:hypothetical protein
VGTTAGGMTNPASTSVFSSGVRQFRRHFITCSTIAANTTNTTMFAEMRIVLFTNAARSL